MDTWTAAGRQQRGMRFVTIHSKRTEGAGESELGCASAVAMRNGARCRGAAGGGGGTTSTPSLGAGTWRVDYRRLVPFASGSCATNARVRTAVGPCEPQRLPVRIEPPGTENIENRKEKNS